MRNHKKKIIIYLIIIAILLILEIILFLFDKKDNADTTAFKNLTRTILQNELENNALNLHYSFFSPDDFGICETTAVLTPFSADQYETSRMQISNYITSLTGISPNKLKPVDQKTYKLLLNYLKTQLQFLDYPYYNEPLSPSGGIHNELIGDVIEQQFTQASNWHLGSGLSIVLMIFIIINMIVTSIFDKDGEGAVL